ncbi:hypothetical protein PTTG_29997 [Puccinia triticina 1-1 BBBD Race 1]|uniref:FAR1 domain-containing protein n=1 Tax=Puccinia triticina (isolate 1-1 / race 1 (BBBD)) TaxID=630390 RepID=A0A180G0X8_PUCT1|nr:hypothetical protein PTTG_29997 [Puccinia triticina 1-1 BBBD Race 1]
MQNCFVNHLPNPPIPTQKKKRGPPFKYHFKLYFACPRRGYHEAPVNSRKAASGRKCGCEARFEIFHHVATDSLRVDWYWKHSHDLNTKEEMQHTRCQGASQKWRRPE